MSNPEEEKLWRASDAGLLSTVRSIMENHPSVDVNWKSASYEHTALHDACMNGHAHVVAYLLTHPAINVNATDIWGGTPLTIAVQFGKVGCVRLLLKDSRVTNINQAYFDGHTPLKYASANGHILAIKWLIASGLPLDTGKPGDDKSDAVQAAKNRRNSIITTLLEYFRENPEGATHDARVELGFHDEMASQVFASVIFVSDGLLHLKATDNRGARFFTIASRLPLELQMVLCFRVVGSAKEVILVKDSEVAFKDLARLFPK